jgi:uncharacterized protein
VKLHISRPSGQNVFTGYGKGFVAINGTRHESHLLVTSADVSGWDISGFDALSADTAALFMSLDPEIVLLGTGASQRFPHPDLARRLSAAGVGLEVMDSNAACRTYNVLMAEGRRVLAAILIDRD